MTINDSLYPKVKDKVKKVDRKAKNYGTLNINEIKRNSISGWVKPSTAYIELDSALFIKGFGDVSSNGGT
jgi:hypothetical protein